MADLVAMDLVPEPTILAAALRACRRVNDYSLTTRILEITKVKCADNEAEFWPYIMQVRGRERINIASASSDEMTWHPQLWFHLDLFRWFSDETSSATNVSSSQLLKQLFELWPVLHTISSLEFFLSIKSAQIANLLSRA